MANHLAQSIPNESLNRFHSSRLNETQMLPMPDHLIRLSCIFTKFVMNYSTANKQTQKPEMQADLRRFLFDSLFLYGL